MGKCGKTGEEWFVTIKNNILNSHMSRVLAFGWFLAAGFLKAEAPLDLDTPFAKTALIQEKTGEITEKSVRKGKPRGELLELEKEDGSLLVLPKTQVLAVLPHLPQKGTAYLKNDVKKALAVLLQAQDAFAGRPELKPAVIAEWQGLATEPNEHDRREAASLAAWIQGCRGLSSNARPEELEKMAEEGACFLAKFPDRAKEIESELQGLRELGTISLQKVDSFRIELGPFGEGFLPGFVLWSLLLFPLVVLLKAFPDAVRGFREGLPLAGLLRVILGCLATAFLVLLLLGNGKAVQPSSGEIPAPSLAALKAGWFSLNHREKWSDQAAKAINLQAEEWQAFLDQKIKAGEGADNFPFWHLAKPRIYVEGSALMLFQPVQAKFLVLPFRFAFRLPPSREFLTDLELTGAWIGKIPIGSFLGRFLWNMMQASYQPLLDGLGFSQGVRWSVGEKGTVLLQVPPTKKTTPKPKDALSATELAEVFEQGYGQIYHNRYVTVSGTLDEVVSRREELGLGTSVIQEDDLDDFYLLALPERGTKKRIRIRCQIKDQDRVFFLDGRGDLYYKLFVTDWHDVDKDKGRGPKGKALEKVKSVTLDKERSLDPMSDAALFRKGGEVRFSAGRIESPKIELEAVTLYDCKKFEVRDQGGDWRTIWQASQK